MARVLAHTCIVLCYSTREIVGREMERVYALVLRSMALQCCIGKHFSIEHHEIFKRSKIPIGGEWFTSDAYVRARIG